MEETEKSTPEHWWKKGQPSPNPNGRPPMTEEEKLIKKAQRDFIKDYKESLKEALPLISPILIAKAPITGNEATTVAVLQQKLTQSVPVEIKEEVKE